MLWRWGGRSDAQSRHRPTNLKERVWDRPRGPRVLICTCCRMRLVEVKRSRCSLISFVETSQISWSGKPWIGYTWQDSERRLHAGSAAGSLYYYKCIHGHADQTSRCVVPLSPTDEAAGVDPTHKSMKERKINVCFTSKLSSMKKASPDTFSNFLSGKSGWRSGMNSLTLFFLQI